MENQTINSVWLLYLRKRKLKPVQFSYRFQTTTENNSEWNYIPGVIAPLTRALQLTPAHCLADPLFHSNNGIIVLSSR